MTAAEEALRRKVLDAFGVGDEADLDFDGYVAARVEYEAERERFQADVQDRMVAAALEANAWLRAAGVLPADCELVYETPEGLDAEIDDLGLRAEVDAETEALAGLQEPAYWPGLGVVSALAAQMLGEAAPLFQPGPDSRCGYRDGYTVHVRPWCRCRGDRMRWR